jgi:hypothetical protein
MAAPWRSRPNSWTTRMPNTTATSDPGTIGATCLSPRIRASDTSPTNRVSQWVSSSSPSRCHSCSKKLPLPLGIPNSLGSCPTTIVRARPMMKPLSTGSEMKLPQSPARASPATTPMMPVVIASVTVRATNGPLPWVARSATAAADRTAVADIGPTTRCRELPKAAYSTSAAGAAYNPRPARPPQSWRRPAPGGSASPTPSARPGRRPAASPAGSRPATGTTAAPQSLPC